MASFLIRGAASTAASAAATTARRCRGVCRQQPFYLQVQAAAAARADMHMQVPNQVFQMPVRSFASQGKLPQVGDAVPINILKDGVDPVIKTDDHYPGKF